MKSSPLFIRAFSGVLEWLVVDHVCNGVVSLSEFVLNFEILVLILNHGVLLEGLGASAIAAKYRLLMGCALVDKKDMETLLAVMQRVTVHINKRNEVVHRLRGKKEKRTPEGLVSKIYEYGAAEFEALTAECSELRDLIGNISSCCYMKRPFSSGASLCRAYPTQVIRQPVQQP
ncbi:MAG: hypothetical protein ABIZ04_21440 [Opitutus sp.]